MLRFSADRGGGYKQSIPAARRTDIIKPGYPGLEAVKPVNPGLKNTPRVCWTCAIYLATEQVRQCVTSLDDITMNTEQHRQTDRQTDNQWPQNLYVRDGKLHPTFKRGTEKHGSSIPLLMTRCHQMM